MIFIASRGLVQRSEDAEVVSLTEGDVPDTESRARSVTLEAPKVFPSRHFLRRVELLADLVVALTSEVNQTTGFHSPASCSKPPRCKMSGRLSAPGAPGQEPSRVDPGLTP